MKEFNNISIRSYLTYKLLAASSINAKSIGLLAQVFLQLKNKKTVLSTLHRQPRQFSLEL